MPYIKESTIEAVHSLDLVEVIQRYVPELRKHGANYEACCPFHEEKSPSFKVSAAKQVYKCFGCQKSGRNAVSFYMHKFGTDYINAVEELANNFGISIEYEDGDGAEKKMQVAKAKAEIVDVNVLALSYFTDNMPKALSELRCNPKTAELFKLGFAPSGWTGLKDYLLANDDNLDAAVDCGLIKKNESKIYDAFRNRLMFPIYDVKNKLVGFSGRTLEPVTKENAKYVNSSESIIYNKSELLFGTQLAKESIIKKEEATMVEGNWDVIRMHEQGITNSVAACGTALTKQQLTVLGKSLKCKRLLMIYDGDNAGAKACLKNGMLALQLGFNVDVIILPAGEDPDTFFKGDANSSFLPLGVELYIAENRQNLIIWKASQVAQTVDKYVKAQEIKEVCKMLAYVHDVHLRDTLEDQVIEITASKKSTIRKAIVEASREIEREDPENLIHGISDGDNYQIPKHLSTKLKWRHIREEVLKYQHFTHENIIYMRRGSDPYHFHPVSNFSIKIIQHMEDEKRPMRLVEICNVHNRKRVFDTSSDDFVTEMGFRKMIEGKGNYDWKGATSSDFASLCSKLKDDMGDGRMITILGWQQEGFWAFNNAFILDGKSKQYNENGCFDFAGESFYVPSGNKIYTRNDSKFMQQKRAVLIESQYSFSQVAHQMMRVHKSHAINGLLFTIATAFSDLIYSKVGFFPIMFLYGEPGSGKDNLIHALQSFFGHPQTAITITGKANTDKAKVRKFAQFNNMIGHMSEYDTGDDSIDQMIKSFWDRVGYERGNIDSSVGTESISITMSLIFTGNTYPTNDALITRFIGEEMNKNEFTQDEKNEYDKLKDMIINGYSSILCPILALRKNFEDLFRTNFKECVAELSKFLWDLSLPDRMIQNASVLGACFKICSTELDFPFTWEDFKTNIKNVYERQSNKRSTGSVVAHFWEAVIEAVKDQREPIEQHREFILDGEEIVLQFTQVYTRYLKQHYNLYKKSGLSKSVLLDKLKKSDCFVENVNSIRYSDKNKSSGLKFNLAKANCLDEFLAAVSIAQNFRRVSSPAPVSNPDGFFEVKDQELEKDEKAF